MEPKLILKPNKTAFVYFNFLKSFLGTAILSTIIFFVLNLIGFFEISYLIFILAGIYLVFNFFNLNIAYNKTNYNFLDTKIIANSGSIFTNYSVELVIKNITHVTMVKPFIEHKLFGVGSVLIELAGSAGVEGVFYYVDNPEEAYAEVKNIMKENGFSLKQNKLIQKEKPSIIGVLLETGGMIFFGFVLLLWFIFPILAFLITIVPPFVLQIASVLILLWIIVAIFINYMNLISRTYYVYSDNIVYYEGFLTKIDSFIPVENLADSLISQTLLEKIFDLHDVKISCQGASHEILFKNLRNGEKMERNIDSLIKNMKPLIVLKNSKKNLSKEVIALKVPKGKSEKVKFDTLFTFETKMNLKRSLVTGLFFVIIGTLFFIGGGLMGNPEPVLAGLIMIPFLVIMSCVGILIKVSCTNYKILEKGVSENFDFLNKRNVEFSNDKITGVIFKKNFVDSWFNTFSVLFWSIGSGQNINFRNINSSAHLKEKILAKLGINNETESYRINSNVSVVELIKANIVLSIVLGIFILFGFFISIGDFSFIFLPIGLIILILILIYYKKWFYSTSTLLFAKNYLYFKAGIFFVNEYYALYDNVKDITTTKYPFSKYGSIMFNVAGETTAQTKSGNSDPNSMYGVPHAFTINYCNKIDVKDDLIDMVLYTRPTNNEIIKFENSLDSYNPKTILVSKPSLKNSLLVSGLFLGILLGIVGVLLSFVAIELVIIPILLFVIGIFWVILSVKVISYKIQPYRVLGKYGIIYKKQTSIVFSKIDHLRNFQGITNKMFKNGSIIIFTTGSGRPELVISNINEFKEFYKKLEDFYQ